MAYSSIKRKRCKCSPECNLYPTLGYKGYASSHASVEVKSEVGNKRQVAKRNKNARNKTSLLLKKDSCSDRIKLLAMADKLFGSYVKDRDSDKDGYVVCVCCGNTFNLSDKTNDGSGVVEPLHFISRSVYSLRFYEFNCFAGCCFCNLKMYLYPEGAAFLAYKNKLVLSKGVDFVDKMLSAKRDINKFSLSDIKEVIEKYKP